MVMGRVCLFNGDVLIGELAFQMLGVVNSADVIAWMVLSTFVETVDHTICKAHKDIVTLMRISCKRSYVLYGARPTYIYSLDLFAGYNEFL